MPKLPSHSHPPDPTHLIGDTGVHHRRDDVRTRAINLELAPRHQRERGEKRSRAANSAPTTLLCTWVQRAHWRVQMCRTQTPQLCLVPQCYSTRYKGSEMWKWQCPTGKPGSPLKSVYKQTRSRSLTASTRLLHPTSFHLVFVTITSQTSQPSLLRLKGQRVMDLLLRLKGQRARARFYKFHNHMGTSAQMWATSMISD